MSIHNNPLGDDANGTTEGTDTHGGNATFEIDVNNGEVNGDPKIEKLLVMVPRMQSKVD